MEKPTPQPGERWHRNGFDVHNYGGRQIREGEVATVLNTWTSYRGVAQLSWMCRGKRQCTWAMDYFMERFNPEPDVGAGI